MKATAAIIAKNESGRLEQCIRSLRSCSIEIVVLDTGSTDGTFELAESLADKAQRSSRFTEDTPADEFHFADARNEAMLLGSCDWVLSIDADEKLERLSIPTAGDVATANIDVGDYRFHGYRWVRRSSGVRWFMRCHEVPRPLIDAGRTGTLMKHMRPACRKDNLARNRRLLYRQFKDLWSDPDVDSELKYKTLVDLGNNLQEGGAPIESLGYYFTAMNLIATDTSAYGHLNEMTAKTMCDHGLMEAAWRHIDIALNAPCANRSTGMIAVDILMNLGRYEHARMLCEHTLKSADNPRMMFTVGEDKQDQQTAWLEQTLEKLQEKQATTLPSIEDLTT